MSINLQEDLTLEQRPRLKEACIRLHDMAMGLEPNAKLPTMLELSSRFGMSVKTLNTAVRELERRNVLRSVNGVGIYVAEQRRRVLTGNIGFMTNNLNHAQSLSYFGTILAGLREGAAECDRYLLLIDKVETFDKWEKFDGVILCDTHEASYVIPSLPKAPKGMPAVSVLNPIPGAGTVAIDDFQGAYDLTAHLLKLGHRRIAYLASFTADVPLLERRREGYLMAHRDAGVDVDESLLRDLYLGDLYLEGDYDRIGMLHMERWFADGWDRSGCTAIMAQNDTTALGVISALRAAGCSVPEISVTGFDGLPIPTPAGLELTTIRIPLSEVGRRAMKLVVEQVDHPGNLNKDILLPGELVVGNTTAPPVQ